MNRLLELEQLNNRYFAMRHGHSRANEQGLIVSHPDNGRDAYGLSELGRDQVAAALRLASGLDADTLVVSSDFKRALDSAQIAVDILQCRQEYATDERLRERFFGRFELDDHAAYDEIWRRDALDPNHEYRGIESASRVMGRVTSLIIEFETQHRNRTILLVSHGDALQIMQTAFMKMDAATHRRLDHLNTAEIRQLRLQR